MFELGWGEMREGVYSLAAIANHDHYSQSLSALIFAWIKILFIELTRAETHKGSW